MKRKAKLAAMCSLLLLTSIPSEARQNGNSVRTSILDNPFVVLAEDPMDKSIHGYVAALRTAPGRTDECKFLFKGEPVKNGEALLSITNVADHQFERLEPREIVPGSIKRTDKAYVIEVSNIDRIGNCDWILGSIGGQNIIQNGKKIEIRFTAEERGDWRALAVGCRKRASFFHQPNEKEKGKAFVVVGDLLYIYDEKPNWYYVKYSNGKSETVGWIRKVDTVHVDRSATSSRCE